MVLRFFLLVFAFLLLSCADVERDNPRDPDGNNYHIAQCGSRLYDPSDNNLRCQSDVIETKCGNGWYDASNINLRCQNSVIETKCGTNDWYNSSTQYCSNGTEKDYGFVNYEGKTYRTVVIGEQTWMAENLNYAVSGSKCYGNNTANCDKYGMLYYWATAMNLPNCGYGYSCGSQINYLHQGICPSGWHIPSRDEWNALSSYVESSKGCSSCDAKHLKSTSGWYSGGNGLDSYGFAALPGGGGYSDGSFYSVGNDGLWWSANEINATSPLSQSMYYDREDAGGGGYNKYHLYSVRCLQNTGIVYGTPVIYEGETYQTIKIGTQTWMAKNLNYNVSGSKCYSNIEGNCAAYGRLYDWATAMALPSNCNSSSCASQIGNKHKGICPSGWHISSDGDWSALETAAGGSLAGRYLKATNGWNNCGNGSYSYRCEDRYGFAALPGGIGYSGDNFGSVGVNGHWWSASEGNAYGAHGTDMGYNEENVSVVNYNKAVVRSVRCVQD